MQSIDIPVEFLDLDYSGLLVVATYHERMAASARRRAAVELEIANRKKACAARVDYLENSYKAVLAKLSTGYNSLESAISAASRELNLPEIAVRGWWKMYIRKRDKAARTERNRVIIDLVRLGFTNKKIAERLGISQNTITRAINEHLFVGIRPCDRQRLYKRRKNK